jgi:signal transduction histidine kinase
MTAEHAKEVVGKDRAALEAQIADLTGTVHRLNEELAETNQGVVALYAELDDKAAQLAEASELKSRFLSYMSHEFRTPLGAIRSIARLLLDRMDGPLSGEQEKQVVFIQQSALELTELVNDLLDLAKIEAGRLSISPAWFEMVDLFAALRGMFRPLLEDGQVALVFEEPPTIQPIFSDDKKLSQILRNFISNALKFTPVGTVRVGAQVEGDAVTFSVSDTGIGIPPEHHASIFEDFTQVDSPLQRKWRGTGLGLSLCKKLADVLGGSVSMESAPGQGSTFQVTLPLRYDAGESSPDDQGSGAETAT